MLADSPKVVDEVSQRTRRRGQAGGLTPHDSAAEMEEQPVDVKPQWALTSRASLGQICALTCMALMLTLAAANHVTMSTGATVMESIEGVLHTQTGARAAKATVVSQVGVLRGGARGGLAQEAVAVAAPAPAALDAADADPPPREAEPTSPATAPPPPAGPLPALNVEVLALQVSGDSTTSVAPSTSAARSTTLAVTTLTTTVAPPQPPPAPPTTQGPAPPKAGLRLGGRGKRQPAAGVEGKMRGTVPGQRPRSKLSLSGEARRGHPSGDTGAGGAAAAAQVGAAARAASAQAQVPTPAPLGSPQAPGGGTSPTVALCLVGHLRTFVLPGVYSSIVQMTALAPSGGDIYLVAHAAAYKGSIHNSDNYFSDPHDTRLVEALAYLHGDARPEPQGYGVWKLPEPGPNRRAGLRLRHVEIHEQGNCSDLTAGWKSIGSVWDKCWDVGNYLQVMWVDYCVQLTSKGPEQYDFIVRSRPDIAILKPLPWPTIPGDRVGVIFKPGTFADWFFIIPKGRLESYWSYVPRFYYDVGTEFGANGVKNKLVEFTIFYVKKRGPENELQQMTPAQRNTRGWMYGGPLPAGSDRDSYFSVLNVAVVIVRSPQSAWCEMVQTDWVGCSQFVATGAASRILAWPQGR